jgi:serine protease SohB
MAELGIFALKAFIILLVFVGVVLTIALGIAFVVARSTQKHEFEVEPLHRKFRDIEYFLRSYSLSKKESKEEKKKFKEQSKAEALNSPKKRVYVLDFDGDVQAHQVESLRNEVTAILQVATSDDEVVLRLKSPGGAVTGYGLAASQLLRLKNKNIPLTACIDEVAASGGYMMACVANKVICAPFAIVGSIGVVAQVPNFNRVLKKWDVDFKEYTAGEYKRTVTMLGEITPEKERHFEDRLKDIHSGFKKHVAQFRPQLNLEKVANGDYWFGFEAKDLGLVDELTTSDDYLLSFGKDTPIFELTFTHKKALSERLSDMMGQTLTTALEKVFAKIENRRLF